MNVSTDEKFLKQVTKTNADGWWKTWFRQMVALWKGDFWLATQWYWEAIDATPQVDKEMHPMIILGLVFMASIIAFYYS